MINKRKKAVRYILMVLITLLVVFPFLWMLVLSFKTNSEILFSPLALPKHLILKITDMRWKRLTSQSCMEIHFLYA